MMHHSAPISIYHHKEVIGVQRWVKVDKLEKKRVTITFEGETLEWIDQQIEEKVFHNYQHAIEYCVMKTYTLEYNRFNHVNVYEDHATIYDNLRKELIDIYFQNDPYCEKCGKSDCEHVQYVLTLPKVVEPLKEKGWTIINGKVITKPY